MVVLVVCHRFYVSLVLVIAGGGGSGVVVGGFVPCVDGAGVV